MTHDALGNKRTEVATIPKPGGSPLGNASHGLTYGHDDANALASANRSVMVSETSVVIGAGGGGYNTLYNHSGAGGYAYDAAYNPTLFSFWNGSADAAASYPVNADNQVAITGINFDGKGNPTTYKSATFSFDPEDRLTTISSPAFSAAYDGDGLRAKKTAAGVTTYFVYDGSTPIAEETFNGTAATFTALNAVTADGWRARKQGASSTSSCTTRKARCSSDTPTARTRGALRRMTARPLRATGPCARPTKARRGRLSASMTRRASGASSGIIRTPKRGCCA